MGKLHNSLLFTFLFFWEKWNNFVHSSFISHPTFKVSPPLHLPDIYMWTSVSQAFEAICPLICKTCCKVFFCTAHTCWPQHQYSDTRSVWRSWMLWESVWTLGNWFLLSVWAQTFVLWSKDKLLKDMFCCFPLWTNCISVLLCVIVEIWHAPEASLYNFCRFIVVKHLQSYKDSNLFYSCKVVKV